MSLLNAQGEPMNKNTVQWVASPDKLDWEVNNVSVAQEWRKAQLKRIEDIINTHDKFAEIYYIVIFAKSDKDNPQLVRETFFVTDQKPGPMFGCQLYKVDNRRCSVTLEWILPLDAPMDGIEEYLKGYVPMPEVIGTINKYGLQPLAS